MIRLLCRPCNWLTKLVFKWYFDLEQTTKKKIEYFVQQKKNDLFNDRKLLNDNELHRCFESSFVE